MNLTTTYMGLKLKNPLVASASPLSHSVDGIRRLADAGASAVVMFSLFEEQLRQDAAEMDHFLSAGTESFAEALSYFPTVDDYAVGPSEYLDILHKASQQAGIPVIGSLNGVSREGWVDYAKRMQDAGASGIELNVYYIPSDPRTTGADVEQRHLDVLTAVKEAVTLPVAIKLSPFFSSMSHMAQRLDKAGADALVLFNRFYQPDFDLDSMQVMPNLNLSTPHEIRLPLLWIAVLKGQIKASLGASRGVHSALEVAKYVMAGADAVMMASVLLKQGPGYLATILKDFQTWMDQKEYTSVEQMKGSMSQASVADPTAFERANYIKILQKYKAEYTLDE
ncbi:MAG: dihydroorotate dehydrogenase-like protein [Lentisphaerae bacterium]|nr:dihydroorotate dehydrogenase-like protein [Lentisphaerota bacterium]